MSSYSVGSDLGLCGNIFRNTVGAIFKVFAGWKRSLVRTAGAWKSRLTDFNEFYAYFAAEWQKLLFVFVYYAVNIALFIEACYRYGKLAEAGKANGWIVVARGFGQLLNFNCALVMLPVMRTILTVLRTLKFGIIAPLDKNLVFHRYIAYNIAIFGLLHGLAHYGNYSCCYRLYAGLEPDPTIVIVSPWHACWGTRAGLTGNLIVIAMLFMYSSAAKGYRTTNNFTIFWYMHHLFIAFFVLLLIHGKNFWMWFLGPGAMYVLERILRNLRGSAHTIVKRVHALPGRVVNLELEKPSFQYEAGQYAFLNCPLISRHEWHPFTISSAPEEEFITFHIRVCCSIITPNL
jgi:NADPH oxidase